jgi:hypothetical protein
VLEVVPKQPDGGLIRDKLPPAGILEESLAKRVLHSQVAKEVAAGDVKVAGDAAKNLPLRALAGTG